MNTYAPRSSFTSKIKFLVLTFSVFAVSVFLMTLAGSGTSSVSAKDAFAPPPKHDRVVPAERTAEKDLELPEDKDPRTTLYLPNIADIAEHANRAVVNIRATEIIRADSRRRQPDSPFEFFFPRPDRRNDSDDDQRQDSGGSGFIVSSDGYIMTNYHVIEDADKIVVRLVGDRREYPAEIIGTDELTDLALLKIDTGFELQTIPLGDSDVLRVGEWVIAIGNPLVYEHTVTVGVVSAKGRKLVGLSRDVSLDDYIQTDAAINRGNSGGPLLNVRGEAIGINSAISVAGQGISFAIPINMARDVMVQLRDTGEVSRGFLGVVIQDIQTDLRAEEREYWGLDGRKGAFIQSVTAGKPADRAGLKPGDAIISVDDEEIDGSDDLIQTISRKAPGAEVILGIVRDNREKEIVAELTSRPPPPGSRSRQQSDRHDREKMPASDQRLGMTVEEITDRARAELKLDPDLEGVVVTHVSQVSDAWERGLRQGDIITEVNRHPISSLDDYRDIVDDLDPGDIMALYIKSPGLTSGRFVTLRVGDE